MFYRGRVRPSKPASFLGMIVGIVFVIIGFTMVMPMGGIFGVLWTVIAIAITGYHGYNLFSSQGAAEWEVDVRPDRPLNRSMEEAGVDFEEKLRKLERLRREGLITEEEFKQKRDEVMRDKW
ncbi:SHOCT domain-containing protein [Paenibacillus sp. 32O-W]|uniref:SHOCT domain-containing protein n=1 Tax=Paenibacillus sp. 32O-W TaxID=1695218 RepID=UPI0011AA1F32|nr:MULTISPECIES: SHOCT domain-containing protein [Paenibacillaceae]